MGPVCVAYFAVDFEHVYRPSLEAELGHDGRERVRCAQAHVVEARVPRVQLRVVGGRVILGRT